ncbi:connector enhancer of kinase suppressor of ras 2-like isoform X2 [Halichondria panicea]|uniref:connector enhancer of kinase suppressor of ras 2-like isoform X2 n=1 Tax=Halichondria panicea TaxID=6063 RepID=UPI00312BB0FE
MDLNGYKQVSTWDTDEVIAWIRGLDQTLEEHTHQLLAHCICGHDLLKLSQQQLEYLKVSQLGHQELLLEAVEQLSTLESGHARSSTISLASRVSKKTSQLINTLQHKNNSVDGDTTLSRIEMTAGVMNAAKSLVSWLERNPSSFISDYKSFKHDMLRSTLELSSILEDKFETNTMVDACRTILKLTSSMMSPENFSVVEPVNLVAITLSPREDTGLGFSIQRTRQGNLLVSSVSEGSPAEELGLSQSGVEIVQINAQNVVGWEVSNVVETLKQSGHEVSLILKIPKPVNGNKEEKDDQTDEGVVADGSNGSCEILDPASNQMPESDGLSVDDVDMEGIHSPDGFQGDTDLSNLQSIFRMKKNASLDLKRTSSVPLTDREKADTILEAQGEGALEETDGGSNNFSPLAGLQQRMHTRTSSAGTPACKVDTSTPQTSYRTQIIGGVVMRIPMNEGAKKGKQKTGSGHGRTKLQRTGKKLKKTNTNSTGSLTSDELYLPTEPDDSSPEKGAVFSDAREVTIGGTTAKQVTVTSISEGHRNDEVAVPTRKKSANPALMVPCFQLKNTEQEGWMNKQGGSGLTPRNWRRRWFVLKESKLYYYKTSFDISALGIVELAGYSFEPTTDIKKKYAFKAVRQGARTYSFVADSADEMTRWIEVLTRAASSVTEGSSFTSSIEASDDEL